MLWILACDQADPKTNESSPTPHQYIYEEEELPPASLQPEDVEAAILEGVSLARDLTAQPVFPAYEAAMTGEDAYCPNYYDYQGNVYWYDSCASDNGGSFEGYSFYIRYTDMDDGAGNLYNGESLSGVSKVVTPEGYTFEAGGGAYYYDLYHAPANQSDTEYTYYISGVQGSFSYDGPEARDTWLTRDLAPDLTYTAAWVPSLGGGLVTIDGGISGLAGDIEYVVLDNLTLYSAALYSTCPIEPGGAVSVRGPDGYWYDVTFDGPMDWGEEVPAETCDGCGTLYFQGEPLGEVCVDVSSLLDWEVSPW